MDAECTVARSGNLVLLDWIRQEGGHLPVLEWLFRNAQSYDV